MKKRLSFFFKCALSAGLLFYLLRRVDFHLLWETFRHVSLGFVLLALVTLFLFHAASALRWRFVGKYLALNQRFSFFWRVYLIGVYFNTFLPGILGGDLVRVFYLVREGAGKAAASASIIYDRGFGLLAALFLVLIFLPWEGAFLPPLLRRALFYLCGGSLVLVLGLILALGPVRRRLSHEMLLMLTSVTPWRRFLVLFILGLLVQVLYAVHVFFLARGLGVEGAWGKFFLIVPLTGILASLPISLGGFGVREGTLAYFLGLLGYPTEIGVALGFLVYGVNLVVGLVGLLVYLRRPNEVPQEDLYPHQGRAVDHGQP